jgi:hypothetical protein
MPAMFHWEGKISSDFEDAANWKCVGLYSEEEIYHTVPWAGDTITFTVDEWNPCNNFREATGGDGSEEWASVTLQPWYGDTVTLATDVSIRGLFLYGGAISQPSSGTDITVTDEFIWTGGTLNSSANASNLILTGSSATGTIAPASGGTVYLGSNVRLEDGAQATMAEGTIDLNKENLDLVIGTGTRFTVAPGPSKTATLGGSRHMQIKPLPEGDFTVEEGGRAMLTGGHDNRGIVTLFANARYDVSGRALDDVAYVQFGTAARTFLYGGSHISTGPGKWVLIDGGILATKWAPSVGSANAHIFTHTLEVISGDIHLNYGDPLEHLDFGTLTVGGNVWWKGGTYHPYVYEGGIESDLWNATGTFSIDGGSLAPIALDSNFVPTTPTPLDSWVILQATGGFEDLTTPSFDDDTWSMVPLYEGGIHRSWKLVALPG